MEPLRPAFTIVSCIKSKPDLTEVSNTALAVAFLPSLVKTVTAEEIQSWRISLYLCADDTDQFYVSNAAAIRNLSATVAPWLQLRLLFYPAARNRVPNREAALQAYTDGADYIHRTNDDISFMTRAWLTNAVSALRQLSLVSVGATQLHCARRRHLFIFCASRRRGVHTICGTQCKRLVSVVPINAIWICGFGVRGTRRTTGTVHVFGRVILFVSRFA